MIDEAYLEKFCTDEINRIGKLERKYPTIAKTHSTLMNEGRMDAYSTVLMLIAQAKFNFEQERD